jgi:hypothetical protein
VLVLPRATAVWPHAKVLHRRARGPTSNSNAQLLCLPHAPAQKQVLA